MEKSDHAPTTPRETFNLGEFQVHMTLETLTIYSTEKMHAFTKEQWETLSERYRGWCQRMQPFTTFNDIAQALMNNQHASGSPVTILSIHRSEPVGVYWAMVRFRGEQYEIRCFEDVLNIQRMPYQRENP